MPTFDVPAGFRDVSEYTFAGPNRRLTVRTTAELGTAEDLVGVARDYAARQVDLLGARADVSPVATRADQAAYIVVVASLPGGSTERSAFVLFRSGVTVHVALTAATDDAAAEAEFRRLIEAARPAASDAPPGPRSLGAAAAGTRQAGPVWVEVPAGYRDVTVLTFQDATAGRRLTVAAAPTAAAGGPLFTGVARATDDRGREFAFEVAPVRAGGVRALAADEPGATAVRDVGGQRVTVRVQSDGPDPAAREIAESVARSVRPVP